MGKRLLILQTMQTKSSFPIKERKKQAFIILIITPKHSLNSVSTSAGGISMNALQRSIPS
jgi:hypothetical protein